MNITKGKQKTAVRAVIYGVEGIGKSTFAAGLPSPLFLDLEKGTGHLDVARADVETWAELETALTECIQTEYQTIIIDTADWAEAACAEVVLKKHGKKSIEDFGFGKGYVILAEEFRKVIARAEALISRGKNVVFLAHSKVVRQSPPDQTDGFDRYELKLAKQVAPILKEWADLLGFANFRSQVVEGTDGRTKATGGKERLLHLEHSAAWDAKNRFGLPASVPFSPEHVLACFEGVQPRAPQTVAAPAMVTGELVCDPLLNEISFLASRSPAAKRVLERAQNHYEVVELSELTTEQAAQILKRMKEEAAK
jgi:hypothetical protein